MDYHLEGDYVLDPIIEKLEHTTGDFFYGYNENQYLLIQGNDIKSNIRYNSFHKSLMKMEFFWNISMGNSVESWKKMEFSLIRWVIESVQLMDKKHLQCEIQRG